jgi:DtxR family Mn-dependent transcriptional regulator
MSIHNSESISESEQMYLITIARSIEDGETQPIPLSHIAQKMSVQPVSVNQMVRNLESEGLLHYRPYKGVELTAQGNAIAFRTLRNRRLWEVFIVDHLKATLEEADAMACDLEHVTPDDIAQRLSRYLNDPVIGPGGQPIPKFDGDQIILNWVTLNQIEVGMKAKILQIDALPTVTRFLSNEGLRSGSEITLRAIGVHDSRLVEVDKGFVEIAADIAETIQLLPTTMADGPIKSSSKG